MADYEAPAIDGSAAPAEVSIERGSRGAVLRFVAGFVVLVMTFLVGYRYAMNSPANIWYLFQVANHTAWTLGVLGESAQVEPLHETGPVKWRVDLAQWGAERRGDDADPGPADVSPLTALESWQWKAWSRIRDGETIAEDGPLVRFVLNEGLASRQAALRRRIEETRKAASAAGEDRSAAVAGLEKRLDDIAREIEGQPLGPERNRANRGEQFSFHVVPDCGAIPSMSIFLAAVLAFPAVWWKRLVGAAGGVSILYAVNIVRLSTLGYIGAIDKSPGRKWFTFAHEYVWQGVFIVFVVVVWMMWVEWLVRPRRV